MTIISFNDGDLNATQNFFDSTQSEHHYQIKTSQTSVPHSGYVNIDISNNNGDITSPSRRRNRDYGYSLSRSKSVCDITSMTHRNLNDIDTESVASSKVSDATATLNRHNASSLASRGSKSSRVVRNRTILGSFPLFYKLSQSLSSLNTNTTTGTTGTTNCASFVEDQQLLNPKLDPR